MVCKWELGYLCWHQYGKPVPHCSASPEPLADHGHRFWLARRIGLAVTDELGMTAQGLPTLHRTNKRNDFDQLRRTIKQYAVAEIVLGLPLRMSGEAGIQAEKVEAFAEELRARFKLPVHLFDERLTSVEANRVLDETDMGDRRRKDVVDQLAAVLILQAFMESRASRRD